MTNRKPTAYAFVALAILGATLVLNFIDRTIIVVLAEKIKESLGIDDASLGFLYGTAFAVFFAVFGIPLARLADVWSRKKIIGLGLFFWSLMTTLSGTTVSYTQLVFYRVGLSIGESAAGPATYSMLADLFPKRMLAGIYGLLMTGIYLGAGLGAYIGGRTIVLYHEWYPNGGAPFGLLDWQLALLIVGVPGLLLSVVVLLLREPKRGAMNEVPVEPEAKVHPLRFFIHELAATIPPFTLFVLYRLGKDKTLVIRNIVYGVLTLGIALGLTMLFSNALQWFLIALAIYSFVSWVQRLQVVDYPCFHMVFKTKSLVYAVIGFAISAFNTYGIGFWVAPYLTRRFQVSPGDLGTKLGGILIVCGLLGIVLGGFLSDILKKKTARARIYMLLGSLILSTPVNFFLLFSNDLSNVYLAYALSVFTSLLGFSSGAALVSEVSPLRMRATAQSFLQLTVTLLGLAMGPYMYGILSEAYGRAGHSPADRLQVAILTGLAVTVPVIIALLVKAAWHLEDDENSVDERERKATKQ